MSISCRLWKLDSERDNFGKKTFFDSKTSKRIRLWINFFTTCQNMNRKFYKASSFETKIIFGSLKSVGKTVFKNPVSWVILHQKNVENGTTAFSGKQKSGEKKKLLNQVFWEASNFESIVLIRVRFWYKLFERVSFWANFSKVVNFGIENLRKCQIIKLCGKFSFKKNSMGSFKPVKQRNKRFRTFLKIINLRRKNWKKNNFWLNIFRKNQN